VLAYDYPFLAVFWTMMIWFLWIVWIVLVFRVIADIFRSHDLGGVAKALWLLFVIVVPLLGVVVYLTARSDAMVLHGIQRARGHEAAAVAHAQDAESSNRARIADELARLAELHTRGDLTDAEFARERSKLLA
jgi:hypothetical protein